MGYNHHDCTPPKVIKREYYLLLIYQFETIHRYPWVTIP
nr:MAG TPA: hypothetical protein [Caudoviricetes sp.]